MFRRSGLIERAVALRPMLVVHSLEEYMIRRALFTALAAVGIILLSVAAMSAADFNGVWKGQAEFPDGQTRELTYTLKVEDGKLNGTIESPRGKIDISDGKVTADGFTFNTMRDGNPIAHEGKWADGKIKITVHTPDGDREYTLSPVAAASAKSQPAASGSATSGAAASGTAVSGAAASAANINGTWKGSIKDENGNDIDLTYDLKVDGNKLTGTVEGPAGKLDLEDGKVDGDKLKFQVSFGDFHIMHDGQLADGKIKITSHMPMGEREYTISRAVNLAGAWESKITTPDGTEIPLKYDFKIDGEKLTGTVEGPRGKLDLKAGKVDGDAISYKVTIGDNEVSYEGQYADGKIKMKSHGGPFGDREYTLTRPAPGVSGAWEATFKDETGNDLPLKFDLKVDGEKLTGTVKSPQGDGELSLGKINGDEVSFDVEINGETIKHKGKLVGNEIKLTVNGFGTQWDLTLKRATSK
jgi:hypothetical protein